MVLHSVEITTPRRLMNTAKRDLGSPAPRTSVHLPPLGTPRLPAAFPTTYTSPRKRNIPLGVRDTSRTPSPQPLTSRARPPSPELPAHNTRQVNTTTPSRRTRNQNLVSPERQPGALTDLLRPLLERQKRSMLKSLQQPPELEEIELYGEDYPPANTAAYEQLSELLAGTVVRGEGNSCMLIGPSGSGKTQVCSYCR